MQTQNHEKFVTDTVESFRVLALLAVHQFDDCGYAFMGLASCMAHTAEHYQRRGDMRRAAACASVVGMLSEVAMAIISVAEETGEPVEVAEDCEVVVFASAARMLVGLPAHMLPRRGALHDALQLVRESGATEYTGALRREGVRRFAAAVGAAMERQVPALFFFGPMMILTAIEQGIDAERHEAALELLTAAIHGVVGALARGNSFSNVVSGTVNECVKPLLDRGDEYVLRRMMEMRIAARESRGEVLKRSGLN